MANEPEASELLPPGCGLMFSWIVTSIIGSLIGWIGGWWVSFIVPEELSTILLGSTMGFFLGFMQWLVLRGIIEKSTRWILVSIVGWGVGFTIGVGVAQVFGLTEIVFGLIVGVITGTFLGISQWYILRGQVTQAGWWVPASAFAWASSLIYYRPGITGIGAMYGILSGIVTGIVLLWLVHRPVSDHHRSD